MGLGSFYHLLKPDFNCSRKFVAVCRNSCREGKIACFDDIVAMVNFMSFGIWAIYLYIRRKLLQLRWEKNMVKNEKAESNPDFLRIQLRFSL